MKSRVYLHIGAPKTGTTYLQERLTRNARSLTEHDVHFPSRSMLSTPALFHFRAALDLLGQDWGGPEGHAVGSWDAMVRRVRRASGTVVISHEILAPAPPDVIAKVKRDLAGAELHVVYGARDLGRQIPAAWQESVKQGRPWPYRRFLKKVVRRGTPWFHRAFDLPEVLTAWGAGLPPEQVHVVTVPRPGAEPGLLWRRFCAALDIDPAWAPQDVDRLNESLGVVETEVIRQLNRRLDYPIRRQSTFDQLIRELLAQTALAGGGSAPVRLPPRLQPWAEAEAERWREWIAGSGVHVVGDVAELRPLAPAEDEPWVNPDKIPPKQQLRVALDALSAMTHEAARRPNPDQRFVAKVRTQTRKRREL